MPLYPGRRPERLSHAPALCLARWLVLGWTWAYTMAVPAEQRTARRAEVLSDLHEQIEQERVSEIAPSKTALHMVARLVLGIWDDLGWSVPFVPASLFGIPGPLRRGHEPNQATPPSDSIAGNAGGDASVVGYLWPGPPVV